MPELKYKPEHINPNKKSKVYFSCHPDDFELYFEDISNEILKISDSSRLK